MKEFPDYSAVQDWLFSLSACTRRNYMNYLRRFCDFVEMDPDQIVKEAIADRRLLHFKVKKWYEERLRGRGLARNTRICGYSAVRSFLNWNDIPLGRTPVSYRAGAQFETSRILEPSEVALMVNMASLIRDKAAISMLAQSGQRVGVLAALKYRHVRVQLEQRLNPILIRIPDDLIDPWGHNVNKTGVRYDFAIGKECAMLLRLMLKERTADGEELTDDSWLFKSYSRSEIKNGKRVVVRVRNNKVAEPLSKSALRWRVVHIATNAGIQAMWPGAPIRGRKVFRHEIHPHVFRRWWKFRMRKGGVNDSQLLEYMMGQRNVVLRHGGSYDQWDPDYIRKEYAKAEAMLTVLSYDEQTKISRGVDFFSRILPVERKIESNMSAQKAVSEWELDSHLAEGWQYIATLPSGRIVIGEPPKAHS
jgi:integrase